MFPFRLGVPPKKQFQLEAGPLELLFALGFNGFVGQSH